jgi:Protein of unknown function (DUF3489)
MTELSQTYGVKSNAKRAMRKLGIPLAMLTKMPDGWRFPIPRLQRLAKKTKAAKAKGKPFLVDTRPADDFKLPPREAYVPRRFVSYDAAHAAMTQRLKTFAPARRPDYMIVIVAAMPGVPAGFGFVPKAHADLFTLAKPGAKPAATAPAAKREQKRKSRGRAANGAGEKHAANVFKMMCTAKGAAMPDVCKETGWLAHTARARMSGIRKAHKKTHDFSRARLLGVTFYYAKPRKAA